MAEERREYRTQDLALAAYLHMQKYQHERMTRQVQGTTKVVVWVFNADDELLTAADAFLNKECRVEPRRFVNAMTETREEMYRFLGIVPRRVIA